MEQQTKLIAVATPTMSKVDYDYVQSLRKVHDIKGYAIMEPHFTLLSINSQCSKQRFSEILRLNLQGSKKFKFSVQTAMFMPPLNDHKSWYAFLIPDCGFYEFSKLQRDMCVKELQYAKNEDFPFIPHITVGSFGCKKDCLQLVDEVNASKFELSGDIEKIDLFEANGDRIKLFDQIVLNG